MTVKYSTAMCYVSPQERATLAIRAICAVSPKKGTGRENLRPLYYISGWTAVERERKVFLEWSINNIVYSVTNIYAFMVLALGYSVK